MGKNSSWQYLIVLAEEESRTEEYVYELTILKVNMHTKSLQSPVQSQESLTLPDSLEGSQHWLDIE